MRLSDVLAKRGMRDEAGFTLVELLLTMVIGLLILGSATLITTGAARHNNEVAMRIEATQRGRLAMDRMERLLRSQVCLVSTVDESATSYPVATANRDTVTFYADLSGGVNIFQHTLTFDPTLGTITDTARKVTGTAPITLASTSTTEQLAIKASRSGTNALFRYYGYPYPTPPGTVVQPNQELVPAAGGLSATDVKRIARIDIDFLVTGATVSTANIKSEMSNQVFVRIADPNGLPDQVAPERNPFDPSCT